MTALVIQTALLLAIAFILGAIIGCILKRIFADDSRSASAGTVAATAAVATAATAAAVRADPAPAPAPVAAKEPDVAPAVLPGHATSASGPVAAATPAPAAPAVPLMAAAPAAAAEKPATPARPKAQAKPATPKAAPAAKPAVKSEAKAKPVAPKAAPAAKPAKAEAKPVAVAAVKAKPAAKPAPAAKPEAKTEAKPKAAAKPKPAAKPAAKAKPAAAPAKDDLKQIKGIGRQNEARLNAVGVSAFAQIAGWSAKDQREMGERLAFPGRIEREEWVAQAKILAKGGKTEFAKRVAKGEVASSTGKGSVGELGAKPKKLIKAARKGKPDNLTLVNGIGNAIEKKLFELGVFHFDQIAGWTQAEAAWVSNAVGFPGRAARENWMEDAAKLAAGVVTDHARRVEEGAIPTSRKSTAAEKRAAAPKGKKGS